MARPKRGLGRGLEALIPAPPLAREGLIEVEVDRIEPNPRQPRHSLDPQALQELADSIREHGLIQPLIVTEAGEGYQLIAGERRWAAARMAGLSKVPAIVKEATPREMLELALVENLQRTDLNPLEAAGAYRQLIEDFGLTQEEVATRVGKNRATVANTLRLLRLPDQVKRLLAEGRISEGHARALLSLETPKAQLDAAGTILRRGLSVRQTEEMVRRLTAPAKPRARDEAVSPETKALEEKFREALGTKVQLFRSKRGGRLVIHFYSEEELQGLYELIVGE
ncbi:MAG TPA: ParB/RepB/Spo0J family partition protein [Anaerolineae bacterium]|nr:ParB/RepB/Spo0J family partition protein [Anaerolineae bacterium]